MTAAATTAAEHDRPAPPDPAPTGAWLVPAHLAVLALALLTSLWRLGTADRLFDEVTYVEAGRAYVGGDLAPNPEHPPLAKLLFGLAERVAGDPLGPRLVAAGSGLAITLLLWAAARHVAGPRWGLAAAATWLALPHALASGGAAYPVARLDRFAMLDVVAAALAAGALAVGWRWAHRPSTGLAVATGALGGLAAAAKLPGALVLPVAATAVVLLAQRRGPALRQVGIAAVASVVAHLLCWAPYGRGALSAAAEPVRLQLEHADDGHLVLLAGQVYERAPWWAHLWFSWRDDGPLVVAVLTVLVLAAAVGAVWGRADRALVAYLGGAVLLPFAVLATSPVALPHYRFLWLAPLVLLAVLGLRVLARGGTAARAVAVLAVAGLAVTGVQELAGVLRLQPGGHSQVACAGQALQAQTVVVRGAAGVLRVEAPALAQQAAVAPDTDLVVLDPGLLSRVPAPDVEAAVQGWPSYDAGVLRVAVAPGLDAPEALRACGLTPRA